MERHFSTCRHKRGASEPSEEHRHSGGVSVKILHAVPQQLLRQKGDQFGKAEMGVGIYERKLQ